MDLSGIHLAVCMITYEKNNKYAVINVNFCVVIKFQLICAFGANLMYVCTGLVFACSGYLIPQLENPAYGNTGC